MAKVRTLQDTKSMEPKKIQGQGYRLGSTREQELEEALRDSIKSNSEITSEYVLDRSGHQTDLRSDIFSLVNLATTPLLMSPNINSKRRNIT